MSFWQVFPLLSLWCYSIFYILLISFNVKSIWLGIGMGIRSHLPAWNIFSSSFYLEVMFILDIKECFLDTKKEESCFCIHSISLCIFFMENWDHWCWELSVNSVSWFLLCCDCGGVNGILFGVLLCFVLYVCIFLFTWFSCLGLVIPCVL